MSKYVIRPITSNDLDTVINFAFQSSAGITSMPKNSSILQKKVEHSLESFSKKITKPEHETYLFALEETETKTIGGICSVISKVGVGTPLYFYQIDCIYKKVEGLAIPPKISFLKPINFTNGPSEICMLYLDPSFRKEGLGRLLSLSRFLFIATFPERFEDKIIAEMRGSIDKNDLAPFWEGVGRHFLDLNFLELMKLLEQGKSFIPHILPDYPIYIDLLPRDIQETIGTVHIKTKPALNMLLYEGFKFSECIDLFDGGPMIHAYKNEIRSIKESRQAKVVDVCDHLEGKTFLASNQVLDFRACYSTIKQNGSDEVIIPKDTAEVLKLKIGDPLRYTELNSTKE